MHHPKCLLGVCENRVTGFSKSGKRLYQRVFELGYPGGVRHLLFGNSGSGKSFYARQVAQAHGLAHLDLDTLVWEPGQIAVPRPMPAVLADLEAFTRSHQAWVIEGCYGDLIQELRSLCTELVFLNPGVEVCLANNRRRPWEPHKYRSPEAQDEMLPNLLAWVADYYIREGPWSYPYHRQLFDGHRGAKREIVESP